MHLLLSDVKMRFRADLLAQCFQLRLAHLCAKQWIGSHRFPVNRFDNEAFKVLQHIHALLSLPAPPRRY